MIYIASDRCDVVGDCRDIETDRHDIIASDSYDIAP